jgi:vacuolar-type H+-ATPase catalytic subunit A/Vma1
MILTELACAAQSAALTAVDEQKARTAAQIGGIAEAMHAAARSLERGQSPAAADYADSAARQIETFADAIRDRRWAELAADLEETARRRPALFVAGAVALGFLAGRFLSAAGRRNAPSQRVLARATEGTVAAAVSSASGNGGITDWPPETDARELS